MSEKKFKVSVWTNGGEWRDQITTYPSMEEMKLRNKDLRTAPGPKDELWGQVGDLILKIIELKAKFLVYSKNSLPPKRRTEFDRDDLEKSKNAVPGQTIWIAENNQGFSYGIDTGGNTWMIEKTWEKA